MLRFCLSKCSRNPASYPCLLFQHRRNASASASGGCPFKALGVEPSNCTLSDVKDKYRDLCKIHHPDVGGSEEKFKSIQVAYEQCKERIESGFVENSADYEHQASPKESSSTAGKQEKASASDEKKNKRYQKYKTEQTENRKAEANEIRAAFRLRFQHVREADAIDALMLEALESDAFARFDVGEPLSLALERYHHGVALGDEHVTRCFQAMRLWEDCIKMRCSCIFYHTLMTHYTTEAFLHHCDAMTVTQSVERVMERMTEQGLPHDDWTISIANRAFRCLPFPDW